MHEQRWYNDDARFLEDPRPERIYARRRSQDLSAQVRYATRIARARGDQIDREIARRFAYAMIDLRHALRSGDTADVTFNLVEAELTALQFTESLWHKERLCGARVRRGAAQPRPSRRNWNRDNDEIIFAAAETLWSRKPDLSATQVASEIEIALLNQDIDLKVDTIRRKIANVRPEKQNKNR